MLALVAAVLTSLAFGWGIATGVVWPALVALSLTVLVILVDRVGRARRTAAGTVSGPSGWEDLDRELERARRYGRPVTVIRMPVDGGASPAGRAAAVLPRLRRVDRAWAEHGEMIAVLPETDRADAEHLVSRLKAGRPEGATSSVAIATCPTDGATRHVLLAALYGAPSAGPASGGTGAPTAPPSNVIELRPDRPAETSVTDRRESSI
jgi:hypothetical protein